MTSAPSALVPVRIPLACCLGLLLTFSGVAVAELRIAATLGNPDPYSVPQVVAPSLTPAATARQSAEPARAAGFPRASLDRRLDVDRLPARGLVRGTHDHVASRQRLGDPRRSLHLVTLDNPQQFQRL
ncbi:hypothetical protein NS2R_19360 [Pseudomonas oryzihabitans]|nr:hypothetical protein NS2R_19360 [Pseudomonas psychrotolerans]